MRRSKSPSARKVHGINQSTNHEDLESSRKHANKNSIKNYFSLPRRKSNKSLHHLEISKPYNVQGVQGDLLKRQSSSSLIDINKSVTNIKVDSIDQEAESSTASLVSPSSTDSKIRNDMAPQEPKPPLPPNSHRRSSVGKSFKSNGIVQSRSVSSNFLHASHGDYSSPKPIDRKRQWQRAECESFSKSVPVDTDFDILVSENSEPFIGRWNASPLYSTSNSPVFGSTDQVDSINSVCKDDMSDKLTVIKHNSSGTNDSGFEDYCYPRPLRNQRPFNNSSNSFSDDYDTPRSSYCIYDIPRGYQLLGQSQTSLETPLLKDQLSKITEESGPFSPDLNSSQQNLDSLDRDVVDSVDGYFSLYDIPRHLKCPTFDKTSEEAAKKSDYDYPRSLKNGDDSDSVTLRSKGRSAQADNLLDRNAISLLPAQKYIKPSREPIASKEAPQDPNSLLLTAVADQLSQHSLKDGGQEDSPDKTVTRDVKGTSLTALQVGHFVLLGCSL